jgi:NADH-quinone oxidoreductase subunit C
MTNEGLKIQIADVFPTAVFDETGEWMNVTIEPASWKMLAGHLRNLSSSPFDYLFCLTCIDWKTHLMMVMHLTSTTQRNTLVIKTKLDRIDPVIDTVSGIWKTAEFHEREIYDLFGVAFHGHPDLRRLFMTDDWNGWPLRKDYEDPVNMIKL